MKNSNLKLVSSRCDATTAGVDNIYIVENSKILRAGIRCAVSSCPSLRVVGESGYNDNFIEKVQNTKANIVMFSSTGSSKECINVVKSVKEDMPGIKTILLADEADEEEFFHSVLIGIDGYCQKDADPWELIRAIKIVSGGGCYINDSLGHFIHRIIKHMGQLKQLPIDKPVEEQFNLTPRELEVMELVKANKTNNEISEILYVSSNTVKMHLSNIFKKLGVTSRLGAVVKLSSKSYEFTI